MLSSLLIRIRDWFRAHSTTSSREIVLAPSTLLRSSLWTIRFQKHKTGHIAITSSHSIRTARVGTELGPVLLDEATARQLRDWLSYHLTQYPEQGKKE